MQCNIAATGEEYSQYHRRYQSTLLAVLRTQSLSYLLNQLLTVLLIVTHVRHNLGMKSFRFTTSMDDALGRTCDIAPSNRESGTQYALPESNDYNACLRLTLG